MESVDILDEDSLNLLVPSVNGITRKMRVSGSEPLEDLPGPVLDAMCSRVCSICVSTLRMGKTPVLSLANGLWVGEVPEQLRGLSYVEKLLIARVRHNRCIVRVSSSGMHKMIANAISFKQPTHKIYNALPPSMEDLDEMLAIVFTGPCAPTQDDFKRTPLLVRRNKVACALEWLVLNHVDYSRVRIDYDELGRYPETGPPVSVEYRHAETNKRPEAVSVH
ncbi:hypothetical protein BJ138DRAFT_1018108, partial [Hygrophoropsis aurantiaca]